MPRLRLSTKYLGRICINQPNNLDFLDISLVDGFNIPMDFSPTSGACRGIRCAANINGECPNELRAMGGCSNPCTAYKTNEYCCTNGPGSCGPNNFSRFFKILYLIFNINALKSSINIKKINLIFLKKYIFLKNI